MDSDGILDLKAQSYGCRKSLFSHSFNYNNINDKSDKSRLSKCYQPIPSINSPSKCSLINITRNRSIEGCNILTGSTEDLNTGDNELPKLFSNMLVLKIQNGSKDVNYVEDINIGKENVCIENNEHVGSKTQEIIPSIRDDAPVISPKCFYSKTFTSPKTRLAFSPCRSIRKQTRKKTFSSTAREFPTFSINKGVRHKIRRKPKTSQKKISIENFLRNVQNEKLRNLSIKRFAKENEDILKQNSESIKMGSPFYFMNNDLLSNTPYHFKNVENEEFRYPLFSPNKINKNGKSLNIQTTDALVNTMFSDEDESEDRNNKFHLDDLRLQGTEKGSEDGSPIRPNRKFFKSGKTSTTKVVQIVNNIKGIFSNGKISILQNRTQRKKTEKLCKNVFSVEQAVVANIINSLNDIPTSPYKKSNNITALTKGVNHDNLINKEFSKDIVINEEVDQDNVVNEEVNQDAIVNKKPNQNTVINEEVYQDTTINEEVYQDTSVNEAVNQDATVNGKVYQDTENSFSEFRKRLPYNTEDPEEIEQQTLLLDFLIINDICTEKNFEIFIKDPDNHKKEAELIVNCVASGMDDDIDVTNKYDEFWSRISNSKESDLNIVEKQKFLLQILIDNDMCTEENFQILIVDYKENAQECDQIINTLMNEIKLNNLSKGNSPAVKTRMKNDDLAGKCDTPEIDVQTQSDEYFPVFYPKRCCPIIQKTTRKQRTFNGEMGINQRQIDAGQKSFGAKQCTHCGLVYSVHEPEEEKTHHEYHNSLHVLRFNGWIDENVVSCHPEWGKFGRIIRIDEKSRLKRKERLMNVLSVVDKELGFSSYVIPKKFVAFLAIRKNHIVGMCLVQPLDKANKYINLNGVDCCTEATFEAKCGISRIWVSPFERRFRIASKLFNAVQCNTFVGQTISLDKIAFSAPTEDGKLFAKKVSGTENFLVYQ